MASNIAVQEVADHHQDPHNVCTKIHYYRKCGCYEDWGLHVWGNAKAPTQWQRPLEPKGSDENGVYWEDCEGTFTSHKDSEVWLVSGRPTICTEIPDPESLPQAFWVTKDLLAWNAVSESSQVYLHSSNAAKLKVAAKGVEGSDVVLKLEDLNGLPSKVLGKFPHITEYRAFRLPADFEVKKLLKSQLALSATDRQGEATDASGIQVAGVLDNLFAYDGPLGANDSHELGG